MSNWYRKLSHKIKIAQIEPSLLEQKIKELLPSIVDAAQFEYDAWDQDEDGYDENLGHCGGICHDIAEKICEVLYDNGIDCLSQDAMMGDQHVWSVAYDEKTEEAFRVDIYPYRYEAGGGFTWTKLPDVVFDNNDIIVDQLDWDDFKLSLEEW
jgi:hypothetical protein